MSGIWTGQIVDRNGDPQDVSFRFMQSDDTLTGKMYGDNESIAIADAKLTGSQITFFVTTELNGQVSKFVYTGTVDGDEMELIRERVDLKNESASGKSDRPNPKQAIRLKRIA